MTGTVFTPWASLGGGMLIGLAAVLLMAGLGRILGATGVLAGALVPDKAGDRDWRIALILGMVSGPAVIFLMTGQMPTIDVPVPAPLLIVGGLIVGVGVTLASGCTSGHGVCGLARLSRRSAVVTVTFMITAAATVFIVRHVLGG